MNFSDTCRTCKHLHQRIWIDKEKEKSTPCTGYCRRYPPIITTKGESRFPKVESDFWCGEYSVSFLVKSQDKMADLHSRWGKCWIGTDPIYNLEKGLKIRHAKTLRKFTRDEVLDVYGIGPSTLRQIEEALEVHGIKLSSKKV